MEALERAFGGSVLSDVLRTTAVPAPAAGAAGAPARKAAAGGKQPGAVAAASPRGSQAASGLRGACVGLSNHTLHCKAPSLASKPWSSSDEA